MNDKIDKDYYFSVKEKGDDIKLSELKNFRDLIENRYIYIIGKIKNRYKIYPSWWSYEYYDDENTPEYEFPEDGICSLYVEVFSGPSDCECFINDDFIDGSINLLGGFPERWLWEDFEEELKAGKAKAKEQKELERKNKKDKLSKKKQDDKDLLLAILNKLDPIEQKFIKSKVKV